MASLRFSKAIEKGLKGLGAEGQNSKMFGESWRIHKNKSNILVLDLLK